MTYRHYGNSTDRTPTLIKSEQRQHEDERREAKTRQATFERGVALALIAGMLEQSRRLQALKEGLRWVIDQQTLQSIERQLSVMHEDVLRAERIQAHDK